MCLELVIKALLSASFGHFGRRRGRRPGVPLAGRVGVRLQLEVLGQAAG
jgi:hypothetical protein